FELDIATNHAQPLLDFGIDSGLIQYSVCPKQNRIERSAQFVTESSEKTVFGGAGSFGVFFCSLQFLFNATTLNEKSDLTTECSDQLEQIGIRFNGVFAKHFDDAIHGAAGEKRKSEAAMQSRFSRRGCARKILVYLHLVNPS